MRAVVFGATSAVGHFLVSHLIHRQFGSSWDEVVVVTRREYPDFVGLDEANLDATKIIRLQFPDEFDKRFNVLADALKGFDAMFVSLGARPSKDGPEVLARVDLDFVLACGKLAKMAEVRHVSVLSSMGADASRKAMYPRIKGLSEERLKELNLPQLHIFRAGALVGRKFLDASGKSVVRDKGLWDAAVNNPIVKSMFRKYSVKCDDLAKSMVHDAEFALANSENGSKTYDNAAILEIARSLQQV